VTQTKQPPANPARFNLRRITVIGQLVLRGLAPEFVNRRVRGSISTAA
jgi:hypothetical protein